MGKLVYIYISVYTCCVLYTLYCVYICVCFTRGIIYSAVLNLSTGCFAVYAKRINLYDMYSSNLTNSRMPFFVPSNRNMNHIEQSMVQAIT